MASQGNPNHDPKTGEFSSGSGGPSQHKDAAANAHNVHNDILQNSSPNGNGITLHNGSSGQFVEGKGPLGKGKYAVTQDGKTLSNYHSDKSMAVSEANQKLRNEEFSKGQSDSREKTNKDIAGRIRSGSEPTDSDLSHLGLKQESHLSYFMPKASQLFGVSSRSIRPKILGLIKTGYSDSGAKIEYVRTKEALKALAR
jgi:hypothetical protein